jgi:hypothetical protein
MAHPHAAKSTAPAERAHHTQRLAFLVHECYEEVPAARLVSITANGLSLLLVAARDRLTRPCAKKAEKLPRSDNTKVRFHLH